MQKFKSLYMRRSSVASNFCQTISNIYKIATVQDILIFTRYLQTKLLQQSIPCLSIYMYCGLFIAE